jgi:hypothetical protein
MCLSCVTYAFFFFFFFKLFLAGPLCGTCLVALAEKTLGFEHNILTLQLDSINV